MDTTASPDMRDVVSTPTPLTLASCAEACSDAGYAYAGFQAAKKCMCANSYGRHGVTTGGASQLYEIWGGTAKLNLSPRYLCDERC